MQAGVIFAKGKDTCVFKPRLQCASIGLENETKAQEARGLSLVSRVVDTRLDDTFSELECER